MKRYVLALGFMGATPALAHPGHDGFVDIAPGLLHPLIGFDHLVVAVAIGLLAVQLGGKALLGVPAAFIAAMGFGITFSISQMQVPFVEAAIALSIIAMGFALFFKAHVSTLLAVSMAAIFGLFHGHAHGNEMPHVASAVAYMVGLVLATGALHFAGIVAAPLLKKSGQVILKAVGAIMALYGFGMLAGFA